MFSLLRIALASCFGLLFAGALQASDYRSVAVPAATLYDAPSQKAKKLFLIRMGTPVEVVVRLEGWVKVRDVEGGLAWVESGQLSDRRSLIVMAPDTVMRSSPNDEASPVGRIDQWVVLEYLGPPSAGWAQVRHRDGLQGYVRATQVWGL